VRVLPRSLVAIGGQIVEHTIGVEVMVIDELYGFHWRDERFHGILIEFWVLLWSCRSGLGLNLEHLTLRGFWDGLR
jgi:hypothetical protein